MLSAPLQQLATNSGDAGVEAMALRARHDLADRAWLRQWLVFKLERHQEGIREIEAILSMLPE